MKKLVLILFFFITLVNANEIITLAKINNHSITNIDLNNEIEIRKILNNNISNSKNYLLQILIEEKVKELEAKKYNIIIREEIVLNQLKNILKASNTENKISEKKRKYMYKKIEISMQWNKLITLLFKNKLEININEIEENIKSKNIDIKSKDEIIKMEKVKKINILSKTYYNKVKQKYLIKKI